MYPVSQFFRKFQEDLDYHLGENTAPQNLSLLSCVNFFNKKLKDFLLYDNKKNTQHGFPIKTTNVEPEDNTDEDEDTNLEEELRSCQHFFIDVELESVGHKVGINAEKLQSKNRG